MTRRNSALASFISLFSIPRRIVDAGLDFLRLEAAGGIILIAVAVLAMVAANSGFAEFYHHVLHETYLRIGFVDGAFAYTIQKNVLHWINDGLMVLFFLLIGLEIKREILVGALTTLRKALLPVFSAVGGMAVPALIYYFVNMNNPETVAGWAIPCATDIAFVLGILSLLGNRVPFTLKVLFLAASILDDLGAIIIIALFYTDDLHTNALILAVIPIIILFMLNRGGVTRIAPYILCGVVLWLIVLESGVHATLAGVITAMFVPMKKKDASGYPPCEKLEHGLHPWIAFLVMPVFAFANAGVSLGGIGFGSLLEPVPLGIILGLIVGKQVGIFGAIYAAVKSGLCDMPEGLDWRKIYGLAVLCGIGFTLSLFVGGLAFPADAQMQDAVRLGVLTASFISAIAGYLVLKVATKKA